MQFLIGRYTMFCKYEVYRCERENCVFFFGGLDFDLDLTSLLYIVACMIAC